jgi:stage II sporulation protein AA (anti-sigma F factor antagonist)
MDVTEERVSGVCILGLPQKIDTTNAKPIEDKILGVIDAGERRLVLDLTRLGYVSSAGLRVFVLATKRLRAVDGELVVFGLTDDVRQIFEIAGFSSFLRIHSSRAEAIADVETS